MGHAEELGLLPGLVCRPPLAGDRLPRNPIRGPFSGRVEDPWPAAGAYETRAIYLSCGSSDETGLPDRSVDVVVTDPPFFDNVHYSELADFFYAWQGLYPHGVINGQDTTRHAQEVQDTRPEQFADKLCRVFAECRRVLKDEGLLAFTYHHSRPEGWTSLASAIYGAGLSVINAHPVKAEMSVATPKSQAKDPIQLDVIFVCRKRQEDPREPLALAEALKRAEKLARAKLARHGALELALSRNDCRVAAISQFLAMLGPVPTPQAAVDAVAGCQAELERVVTALFAETAKLAAATDAAQEGRQLTLFASRE